MKPVSAPEPFIPDALIEDSLSQNVEQENSIKTVSKELFSHQNIDLKTEIDHNEINNITRIKFLDQRFKIRNMNALIDGWLRLRVSKERKSRREFIDALQTENRSMQGTSVWGSIKNAFGGGGNNNP